MNITARLYDYEDDQYKTGINWDRVRILVDGIDYTGKEGHFSYDKDGTVSLSGYKWADGTHRVEVVAQDNFGNETTKTEYFNIDTNSSKITIDSINNEAVLGGDLDLALKSISGNEIKNLKTKINIDNGFLVESVDFSNLSKNGIWNYNSDSGELDIYCENEGLTNGENILANIKVKIPNTAKLDSELILRLLIH